jgi:hypothetical protein
MAGAEGEALDFEIGKESNERHLPKEPQIVEIYETEQHKQLRLPTLRMEVR